MEIDHDKQRREHLAELLRLPSTQEIRAKIAEWKPLDPKVTFARDAVEKMHEGNRKAWEQKLQLGLERDALQAQRPAGCWCLGSGQSRQKAAMGMDGQSYVAGIEYCTCTEGQQEQRIEAARKADEKHDRLLTAWERAGIPSRFYEFTLESSPLAKAKPKLIKSLEDRLKGEDGTGKSLYLWGGYGVGKTGLAVGYAYLWAETVSYPRLLFRAMPKLLAELRATYGKRRGEDERADTEEAVIDRFINVSLLIVDDLGAEQISGSGWVEDRLYRIIGERHDEMRPTIFTSNLNLEQLAARIGERITWRIVEMCGKDGIVELKGQNLRDKA